MRTGKNVAVTEYDGEVFKAGNVCLEEEGRLYFEQVGFTKRAFRTNLDFAPQIERVYKKRFKIEPFFRDLKSGGFHIHRSGLGEPERLKRLLIAACIACVFCILGTLKAYKSKFYDRIALKDIKLLSLFQLGRRFIKYLVDIRQWSIILPHIP